MSVSDISRFKISKIARFEILKIARFEIWDFENCERYLVVIMSKSKSHMNNPPGWVQSNQNLMWIISSMLSNKLLRYFNFYLCCKHMCMFVPPVIIGLTWMDLPAVMCSSINCCMCVKSPPTYPLLWQRNQIKFAINVWHQILYLSLCRTLRQSNNLEVRNTWGNVSSY